MKTDQWSESKKNLNHNKPLMYCGKPHYLQKIVESHYAETDVDPRVQGDMGLRANAKRNIQGRDFRYFARGNWLLFFKNQPQCRRCWPAAPQCSLCSGDCSATKRAMGPLLCPLEGWLQLCVIVWAESSQKWPKTECERKCSLRCFSLWPFPTGLTQTPPSSDDEHQAALVRTIHLEQGHSLLTLAYLCITPLSNSQ